jgi:hypothetical protein
MTRDTFGQCYPPHCSDEFVADLRFKIINSRIVQTKEDVTNLESVGLRGTPSPISPGYNAVFNSFTVLMQELEYRQVTF